MSGSNTPSDAGQQAGATRQRRGGGRVPNGVVALGSAAVLAIYSAGYLRTQAAADRFAAEADQRRPSIPAPVQAPASPGPDLVAAPQSSLDDIPAGVGPADPVAVDVRKPSTPTDPANREQRVSTPAPAATPVTRIDVAGNKAAADTTATPVAPAEAPAVPTLTATIAGAPTEAATTAMAAAPETAPATPAAPKYKDGTYTGWGTSRHGDIQAQVVIVDGRITSATIAQCMTRWPCSWIEALPPQVVQRQSPETDFVSGATQSTNAFYYGVVQALGKAALP